MAKHGVSFELAITAFDDPFALIAPDDAHSTSAERREWLIGESDRGLLVVVFTTRSQGQVYRIIRRAGPVGASGNAMKTQENFPFERARRVTAREVELARQAIEERTGVRRPARGRPPKAAADCYRATSIRLHPKVLAWARREAKRRKIGYQTVINEVLLERAG